MIMTVMATSQPSVIAQNENMMRSDRKSITERYFSTSSSRIHKNKFSLFKIQENRRLLEGFRNLPNNWNTYGAGAFENEFVERVAGLLSSLDYQPKIFPTGRNSIQLEYYNDADYLEFEINNNNVIDYYSKKSGQEAEGETTFEGLNSILENFYA